MFLHRFLRSFIDQTYFNMIVKLKVQEILEHLRYARFKMVQALLGVHVATSSKIDVVVCILYNKRG